MEREQISLLEGQDTHVENLKNIFMKSKFAIDCTKMGGGKTYTSAYISKLLGFKHVIIITLTTMEMKWREICRKYGIPARLIINYESLRSVSGLKPRHNLLCPNSKGSFSFRETPVFQQYVKEGCLLIADEFYKVKNMSRQRAALKALTSYIYNTRNVSRMLFTSGTPFDKKIQVANFLNMIGISKSPSLCEYQRSGKIWKKTGLGEIYTFCKSLDPEKANEIYNRVLFIRKKFQAEDICFDLYTNIIQPRVSVSMSFSVDVKCANGYFEITPEEKEPLYRAVSRLGEIVDDEKEGVDFVDVNSILAKVEYAKIGIFTREAKKILESDETSKVTLMVNYTRTLEELSANFAEYNPLVMNGKTPRLKRQQLIEAFQKPNLERRVLISNMEVAHAGIDLDDKHGGFTRYGFGSPCYSIMRMHQVVFRLARRDSKSVPYFFYVYANCGVDEISILNSLSEKSGVMKSILIQQVKDGVVFPGDYPRVDVNEENPCSNLETTKLQISG